MKFFKDNWFLICVILIAFFFLRKWGTGYFEYKHEIRTLSDSIAVYDQMVQSALDREAAAKELIRNYELELDYYRSKIEEEKNKRLTQKQKYDAEIIALKRIPTDTLYLELTGWLDTLSFE